MTFVLKGSLINPKYPVTTLDSAEPVSNHYDSELPVETFNGLHHRLLGAGAKRTCGFIENQNPCLLVERSSNADPLPLSAT